MIRESALVQERTTIRQGLETFEWRTAMYQCVYLLEGNGWKWLEMALEMVGNDRKLRLICIPKVHTPAFQAFKPNGTQWQPSDVVLVKQFYILGRMAQVARGCKSSRRADLANRTFVTTRTLRMLRGKEWREWSVWK